MDLIEQLTEFVLAGTLRPSDWHLARLREHVAELAAAAAARQATADVTHAKHSEGVQTLAAVQAIWDRDPLIAGQWTPPARQGLPPVPGDT